MSSLSKDNNQGVKDNPMKIRHSSFRAVQQQKKEIPKNLFYKAEYLFSFETISLFSVDQIREKESPWQALTEIAFHAPRQSKIEGSVKRSSPFKQRLQERKKVCMLYGNLSKRVLDRYLKEISRPEDLLLLLESRLDIVLKRSSLFPCIQTARKSILQGSISVNHQVVRSPRFHCTPGDIIKILEKRGDKRKGDIKALSQDKLSKKGDTQLRSNRDRALCLNEWDNVFAVSERLKVWDRQAGRLHTSVLKGEQKLDSQLEENSLRIKGASLMPLQQPITNIAKDSQKHKNHSRLADTDFLNSNLVTLNPRALHDTSSLYDKEDLFSIEKRISNTNKLKYGERAEWESPPFRHLGSRPPHLEISYRSLCVIFLYSPQRVCVDISIDLSRLC